MILTITVFFALALVLYAVFGGADFGAGMIEGLISKEHRKEEEELISHAMAPVWEANHVWLVLAVVILFSAFPKAYSEITTVFHIPLLVMLFGIILRGCAFTFRHYDPYYDGSQRLYGLVFVLSSFLTPIAQGLVIGGCMLGDIPMSGGGFAETFVSPWLNLFSASVSLFLCAMYIFVAAVFLVGETDNEVLHRRYIRRVKESVAAMLLATIVLIVAGERSGYSLLAVYKNPTAVLGILSVLLSLWLVGVAFRTHAHGLARIWAASAAAFMVITWFAATYPFLIGGFPAARYRLSLIEGAAPSATLWQLLAALFVGLLLVLPLLAFLFAVFKSRRPFASQR